MSRIFDISLTITPEMPVWPGDNAVQLERVMMIEKGDEANVTSIKCSLHVGTHVDAPLHFIDGEKGVDKISLDELIGTAQVIVFSDECSLLTASILQSSGIDNNVDRVLFRTRNSNYWANNETRFQKDYVAISPDGAEFLLESGIRLLGVDYLSVAPFNDQISTHRILLGAGVILVEGLNLYHVQAGIYQLLCLPLKIRGSDGAPARAVLIQD